MENNNKTFLQIDDKYRIIVADPRNFVLEELQEIVKRDKKTKKRTNEVEYQWVNVGYHGLNLDHALNAYLRRKTRDNISDELETDIDNLIEMIRVSSEKVRKAVEDVEVVIRDGEIVQKVN